MAKILIIGRNGQVSTYLQRQLADGYDVIVAGRDQLDLSDVESVHAKLVEIAPQIIINPAGWHYHYSQFYLGFLSYV